MRRLASESRVLVADDGTRLLAELDLAGDSKSTALVVLIHGWEGSSRSSYLVTTAATLLAQAKSVVQSMFQSDIQSARDDLAALLKE